MTRTGIAIALEDQQLASKLLTEVRGISLSEKDRVILAAELERADEIAQTIH
ncbi:MAG: hypothetical protein KF726_09210 [Anaerolineae bacterium]|nr:hypothetical protein [Anaerolineae bacterium]